MKNRTAIIVGNGKSREEVDLNSLVDKSTIYGCNALYRDFEGWDFLVAIDDDMIQEITDFYATNRVPGITIFPPEDERWEETTGRRSNAGMVAMREAIRRGADVLYCLGFDFIMQGESSISNVYHGTPNYGSENRASLIDNYYRMNYLEWFAIQNPNVKIVFVIPDDAEVKPISADNIVGMRMSTFLEKTK